jgi:hypothetical protein
MKPQWAIEPTFRLAIPASKDDAIRRFQLAIEHRNDPELYLAHGEYAELHLETDLHRLWSPHLTVYFIDGDESRGIDRHGNVERCLLMGRFAPRPNLWTLIWIFYLAFFCTIFFASIFAGSQWLIGEFPWGLAIVGATAVLYLGLFVTSQIGQSLCGDQMDLLRGRLGDLLRDAALEPNPNSR